MNGCFAVIESQKSKNQQFWKTGEPTSLTLQKCKVSRFWLGRSLALPCPYRGKISLTKKFAF